MASNYQLRKALYKQIKSKDLEVSITASNFFRLVKLDDDTFLLNIDIQTDKGNITIKGLTKNNFNSYNTTSDIQLYVDTDNIVYVKNTSTTTTKIISTSIELVKGILNESYFDLVTTAPESDRLSVNGTTTLGDTKILGKLEIDAEQELTINGTTTYNHIKADTISGNDDEVELLIQGPPTGDITLKTDGKMVNIESNTSIVGTLGVSGAITGNLTGNAATATALETARAIGGVSFDGTIDINLPGVNITGDQDTTGNAATATALETAREIGGVSFDGSANIDLPGVNTTGNQDTTGNADTATKLSTDGIAGQFLLHDNTWGGLTSSSQGVVTISGVDTNLTDLQTSSTPTFEGIKISSIEPINNDLVIGTTGSTTTIQGKLEIEGEDLVTTLALKVDKTSIIDNLTTDDTTKVLSAKQGKVLNDTTAKLAVSNVFTQPQIVPNAINNNEAVNLGQLNTVVSIWRYE